MKNNKKIIFLLAFLGLSLFQTAFGDISITTNTFSYTRSVCLQASTFKVFDLKVENLDSAQADSGLVESLYFQHNGYPFSLGDSLYLYTNTGGKLKIVDRAKFVNGYLTLYLNKWVRAKEVINLIVFCRSLTVTEGTSMNLNLVYFSYRNRYGSNGPWLGLPSPGFSAVDCSEPSFGIDVTTFFGSRCYQIGDTAYAFAIKVSNPNPDSTYFKATEFIFDEEPWFATIDSVFIFDGKTLLAKGKVTDQIFSLNFNKYLDSGTSFFKVYVRASSRGQLVLRPYRYLWQYKKREKYWDRIDVSGPYEELRDCTPKVKLQVWTPNNKKSVCEKEAIGFSAYFTYNVYDAHKVEYFVNGKLYKSDSNFVDKGSFPYYDRPPLYVPQTTVMVKVTDMSGRFAYDSIVLDILKNPKIKASVSSTQMCAGDYVVLKADTIGLTKWSWGFEEISNTAKTTVEIFDGGKYYFSGIDSTGCQSDTGIQIYKTPGQKEPKIIINEWVIGSDQSADSFVWSSFDPMTQKSTMLKNSNKMFMSNLPAGYYAVRAFNKYGCSEISSITYYNGYVAKDSLPHVKLLISAPKPGTRFCSNEQLFASRSIVGMFAKAKEVWTLNDDTINFTKQQLFDGMQFSLPMNSASIKVKVIVWDTRGKYTSDSFVYTVFPNPKITLSHTYTKVCSGDTARINLVTMGLDKWSWDDEFTKATQLKADQSGKHTLVVYSEEGCTTDTNFYVTVFPKQERLYISSYDTLVWVNQKANRLEWFYNGTSLGYNGKQVINRKQSGFYQVGATSDQGCMSTSDLYYFSYVAPKPPVTPKDSSEIKITTSTKVVNGKVCVGPFDLGLDLYYLNQANIKTVKWFMNNDQIYAYDASCLCKIAPGSINIPPGLIKIVVVVNLSNGKIKTDTVEVISVFGLKAELDYDKYKHSYCPGQSVNLAVKEPWLFTSVYWPKQNIFGERVLVKDPNGTYFAQTIDLNGCTSYSDTTVEFNLIQLPRPILAVSNCELFADIDYNQIGGSWSWYLAGNLKQVTNLAKYKAVDKGFWKVSFTDSTGCISTFSNTEFVECKMAGAKGIDAGLGVKIYPNPATDQFIVESPGGGEAHLVDMQGRVVRFITLEHGSNTVYRDGLAGGIYLLSVNGDTTRVIFR